MNNKIKILFVTPFYNYGGSEVYIYELLNNIDYSKFEFSVLSDYPGDFTQLNNLNYPVYINQTSSVPNKFRLNKIIKKTINIDLEFNQFKNIINKQKPDIIYINTAILSKYANYSKKLNIPYLVHFHELNSIYENINTIDFENMIDNAIAIICCSNAVKKEISKVRKENVFIQFEHIKINEQCEKNINFRKEFNLPENSFIWMMSGLKSYRKGFDLVPEICNAIEKYNAHLLWVGNNTSTGINSLVKRNNIKNFIDIGLLNNNEYQQLFLCLNGFVLTSREDPFPLVMIEAATNGLPIISFNSGGVNEFIREGMGKVVPNNDINSLINEMINVMNGTLKFDKNVSLLRSKEFDVKIKSKEWEQLIYTIFFKNKA